MYVESYDEEGAAVYDMIIKQIFQDLQLGPSIVDLRAFVDPKNAMFIFAIKRSFIPQREAIATASFTLMRKAPGAFIRRYTYLQIWICFPFIIRSRTS